MKYKLLRDGRVKLRHNKFSFKKGQIIDENDVLKPVFIFLKDNSWIKRARKPRKQKLEVSVLQNEAIV